MVRICVDRSFTFFRRSLVLTASLAGLAYEVIEPKKMKHQSKSYGDNFRYGHVS